MYGQTDSAHTSSRVLVDGSGVANKCEQTITFDGDFAWVDATNADSTAGSVAGQPLDAFWSGYLWQSGE